jgi:DNA replication protein DnaC
VGRIFGDDVMAAPLIDRLVHHCHLVTIRGNSYRMGQYEPGAQSGTVIYVAVSGF